MYNASSSLGNFAALGANNLNRKLLTWPKKPVDGGNLEDTLLPTLVPGTFFDEHEI